MSASPVLPQRRRIPAPQLAALGFAAAVIAAVLGIRGLGVLNNPYFQVDVEARDLASGDVEWTFSEGMNSYPSFGTDLMFVPVDGATMAIDDRGSVRWRLDGFEASSSEVVGDLVYLMRRSPSVIVAVDRRTGETRWKTDRRLVDVGDDYAIVRSGSRTEVVAAGSGVVVHVEDDAGEAATAGQVVAYFVERALHVLRPETDVSWELSDTRWRNILAVVDPIVVVSARAETTGPDPGGRQQVVAGYDSRTSEVRWEVTVPAYLNDVDVDDSILRLRRGSDVMEIDVVTGDVMPMPSAADLAYLDLTRRAAGSTSIVGEFARVENGVGAPLLLSTGPGERQASTTIAVDMETRTVLWTMIGAAPVAGNGSVIATCDAASFRFLDAQSGIELGAVPTSRRWRTGIATKHWISVLAAEGLVAVDATGQRRIVADGLSPTARIEGAAGDIVVVAERRLLPGSSVRRRLLTAYDLAGGQLWQHRIRPSSSITVGEDSVVVAKDTSIVEINLRTGEIDESEGEATDRTLEPSSFVVAAFDLELQRLLWSHAVGVDEHVAVIGDAALIVDVTRANR